MIRRCFATARFGVLLLDPAHILHLSERGHAVLPSQARSRASVSPHVTRSAALHPLSPLSTLCPALLVAPHPVSLPSLCVRWSDFLDASSFSLPSESELNERVNVNLLYWQGNYFVGILLALLTVVSASLHTEPDARIPRFYSPPSHLR